MKEVSDSAETPIDILKHSSDLAGNHGDGYSFDGRGGTLGHAFYPEDGRVHLDLEEPWYLASDKSENHRKKDVFTAALHEFGHTVGLLHSKDREYVTNVTNKMEIREFINAKIFQSNYGAFLPIQRSIWII